MLSLIRCLLFWALLATALSALPSSSFASEDNYLFPLDQNVKKQKTTLPVDLRLQILSLTPRELYDRTEQVLELFQAPAEKDTASILKDVDLNASQEFLTNWIPYMDASKSFSRFFQISEDSFSGFRDRDSKSIRDFQMPLTKNLYTPTRKSLKGLRIALDPGHMGSDVWDEATGKFVKDSDGTVISEGVINLQTCLLLKDELERLGAIIMVTHTNLAPVTDKLPKDLDLNWFGKMELRERSLDNWFLSLLNNSTPGELEKNFRNDTNVQTIFSESKRMNYFILREDLSARADKVQAFNPDLTLIIHFDAAVNEPLAKLPEITRAYVPGALTEVEYAGTRIKAEIAARLLQAHHLQESLEVSRAIVHSISKKLNTTLLDHDLDSTIALEPGIFARNLALNHKITKGATSYIECLMYGSRSEFDRLKKTDHQMTIGGKVYPYSDRLQNLVFAIRDAVAGYYR